MDRNCKDKWLVFPLTLFGKGDVKIEVQWGEPSLKKIACDRKLEFIFKKQ